MNLKIIYEDADAIVLDKPAGLTVDELVRNLVTHNLKLETLPRGGLVHRLDKETSGVLVVAKNKETLDFLQRQFIEGKVKKTYEALVYGLVDEDEGVINKPISRSPQDFRRRT